MPTFSPTAILITQVLVPVQTYISGINVTELSTSAGLNAFKISISDWSIDGITASDIHVFAINGILLPQNRMRYLLRRSLVSGIAIINWSVEFILENTRFDNATLAFNTFVANIDSNLVNGNIVTTILDLHPSLYVGNEITINATYGNFELNTEVFTQSPTSSPTISYGSNSVDDSSVFSMHIWVYVIVAVVFLSCVCIGRYFIYGCVRNETEDPDNVDACQKGSMVSFERDLSVLSTRSVPAKAFSMFLGIYGADIVTPDAVPALSEWATKLLATNIAIRHAYGLNKRQNDPVLSSVLDASNLLSGDYSIEQILHCVFDLFEENKELSLRQGSAFSANSEDNRDNGFGENASSFNDKSIIVSANSMDEFLDSPLQINLDDV